jgi:hypothetical protein
MNYVMGGRLAAIVAAAGWLCVATTAVRAENLPADTAQATEAPAEAAPGKPVALNKYSKRKRSAKTERAQKPRVVARGYRPKGNTPVVVPPFEPETAAISDNVANANAQWPAPDTSIQSVTPPTTTASAATDQLNDGDRDLKPAADNSASEIATKMAAQVAQNPSQAAGVNVPTSATPATSNAMASADKPMVASTDDSAWGQSSLIGKIFIAFGGLLTVASAARMFMA